MLRSLKKRFKKESAYYFMLFLIYIGSLIPRSLVLPLGKFIGLAAYKLLPKPRRKALKNLNSAIGMEFSVEEIHEICRRNFEHWAISLFEVIGLLKVKTVQDLNSKVKVSNLELLNESLKDGKGVILLTPHLGNWEIAAAYLSLMGYKFAVLAKEVYDLRLNSILLKIRGGRKIVNIPRDSIFTAVKYLKTGYILGILPDQATNVSGIYINFFHKPAYTPIGPAKLSIKTETPMLLFYNYRDAGGKINIVFDSILENYSNEEELTLKWSRKFEEYILRFPEQWVWLHDRWKKI